MKTVGRRIYTRKSLEEIFWSHVARRGDDECWDWTASTYSNGYGHIRHEGHDLLAHRVSWELNVGPIPDDLLVLHHCDRPICVAFKKCLFLGTPQDNTADMLSKNRHASAQPNFVPVNLGQLKPVCLKGHPMTPENVVFTNRGKARRCSICYQDTMLKTRARYRAIAKEHGVTFTEFINNTELRSAILKQQTKR